MKAGRKVLAGGMPVGTGNEMTVGTASGMAAVTANGMAAVTANEMAAVTASVTGVGRGGGVATQVPRERSENAIAAQIERRKMPKRNKVGIDEFKEGVTSTDYLLLPAVRIILLAFLNRFVT